MMMMMMIICRLYVRVFAAVGGKFDGRDGVSDPTHRRRNILNERKSTRRQRLYHCRLHRRTHAYSLTRHSYSSLAAKFCGENVRSIC